MPDTKISGLPEGGDPQDQDQLSAARGTSSTIKLVWGTVRAWLEARFAPLSHVSDTGNPHMVTAAQAGADATGTADAAVSAHDASGTAHGSVEANFGSHTAGQVNSHTQLDTHVASTANPHAVTAAQVSAIPETLTADGELLSYDGVQYTKIGIGLDGQVPTARPGGSAGEKIVWEDQTGGGGASPLTTKGDLFTFDTADARIPVGNPGQILVANPATSTGLEYVDPPSGTGDVSSASNTVDGEIQLGAATAKGIKGLVRAATGLPLLSGGTGAGVGPTWSQMNGATGLINGTVTFAKLENFAGETLLLRGLGSGPPADTKISALANHAASGSDLILVETAAGLLRHSLAANFLDTGGDLSAGAPFVIGDMMAAETATTAETTGFAPDVVARRDIANTFAAAATFESAFTVSSAVQAAVGLFGGTSSEVFFWGEAGTPNARYFTVASSRVDGLFEVTPVNDGGVPSTLGLRLNHAGGAAIGSPTGGVPATRGSLNVEQLLINGGDEVVTAATVIGANVIPTGDGARGLNDSGVIINNVLTTVKAETITEVGYAATPTIVAGATASLTPVILDNNWYEITALVPESITINPPTVGHGGVSIYCPSNLTVSLGAFTTVIGSDVAAVNRWLEIRRVGTFTQAIWVAST